VGGTKKIHRIFTTTINYLQHSQRLQYWNVGKTTLFPQKHKLKCTQKKLKYYRNTAQHTDTAMQSQIILHSTCGMDNKAKDSVHYGN